MTNNEMNSSRTHLTDFQEQDFPPKYEDIFGEPPPPYEFVENHI